MKKWMILAWLAFPGIGAAGQADPFLAGRACMQQGLYDSARVQLEVALASHPGDADILFQLGICQFHLDRYPAARESFYEAEKRRTGMGSLYLARTEMRMNHPELALKYLKIHLESRYRVPEQEILLDEDLSSLEDHPGWQQLWNEKEWYSSTDKEFQEALFMAEHGEELEAINQLNRLEKQGYERSLVQAEKARIYADLGNKKAARSAWQDAVRSDTRNLDALYHLSASQLENGDPGEALQGLSRVIRQQPDRFEAYLLRAEARSATGQLNGALEDLDVYLTYFPESPGAQYRKGLIQYDHGKYLDAIQSFNRALEGDAGKAEYYFARGRTYARTGTTRYADRDMSMALDLDPYNGEIWFEKGKLSESLGLPDDACHCYRKAFQYGIFEANKILEKRCR
jgi:tetratricopeptide (TPR) repeat protein